MFIKIYTGEGVGTMKIRLVGDNGQPSKKLRGPGPALQTGDLERQGNEHSMDNALSIMTFNII